MEIIKFIDNNNIIIKEYFKKIISKNKSITFYNNFIEKQINNGKILFYTSFIFLTNVLASFYKRSYIHSFVFVFLFMTSSLYHFYKPNLVLYYIDQVAIYTLIFFGSLLLYRKIVKSKLTTVFWLLVSFILILFLVAIILYVYGSLTNSFCYDKNHYIANLFHSLLHFTASLGNHLLIILI
jgi:hypothetical protein